MRAIVSDLSSRFNLDHIMRSRFTLTSRRDANVAGILSMLG
jgi:hypothetical protein